MRLTHSGRAIFTQWSGFPGSSLLGAALDSDGWQRWTLGPGFWFVPGLDGSLRWFCVSVFRAVLRQCQIWLSVDGDPPPVRLE